MANQRFTLRITPDTDIALATQKLEQALAEEGVINPSLTELLVQTAQRFQNQLADATTIDAGGSTPRESAANTLIRGDGYSIRITTKEATGWSRLTDRLLRRPAAFS